MYRHLFLAFVLMLIGTASYFGESHAMVVYPDAGKGMPRTCDQSKGISAITHDFDTLFVFYQQYPDLKSERAEGFPEALKFDNFNERLLSAIRENFKHCLVGANGKPKNIEISLPPNRHKMSDDERCKFESRNDAKNLTVYINVTYRPMKEGYYGYVSFFMHRPNVPEAQIPMLSNSHTMVFFPHERMPPLEAMLNDIFSAIEPKWVPSSDKGMRPAPAAQKKKSCSKWFWE
mgnify:CR=1 FL=1